MPEHRLITAPSGALEVALADEIRARRGDDPLAPVAVLVGGTLLRPYLRRRLAEQGGAFAVEFLTAGELALRLGGPALEAEGRRALDPLGETVLARLVAGRARGYLSPVAHAPGFANALHRLIRELRQAGLEAADVAVAADGDPKLEALARLAAEWDRAHAGFFGADDGYGRADPALLGASSLVVYGVWEPPAALRAVLSALMEAVPVSVLLPAAAGAADDVHAAFRGWFGEADRSAPDSAPATSALEHLQRHLFTAPAEPAPEAGSAVRLVSAPDPAREVRAAARACLRWAREGIPFHEMALLYRESDPYRALAEAVFREAGVPVYLHEGTPLAERPLGRRAIALLELVDSPLERGAVMRFLTDARLPDETWERHEGVPAARWDAISRRAGVVEGRAQWVERLGRYHDERAAAEPPPPPDSLAAIDRLIAFLEELDDRLGARRERASWSEHSAFFAGLCATYLDEAEPLTEALAPLAELDAVEPTVSFARFRSVVVETIGNLRSSDVLDARPGSFSRRGVNVIDVNSARGLGFRAVAVLGLTDRAFPPPPRPDPLLLDEERAALNERHGWELPLRVLGADPEPLQFASAVQGARERLMLSFSRRSDRDARPLLPSAFFRAAAEALTGERVRVQDVDRLPRGLYERLPAGRLGAPRLDDALTAAEYDRTLVEADAAVGRAVLAGRAPNLARAAAQHRARWESLELTEYDGVLSPAARPQLALRDSLSPTSLESYATCPYRFFLDKVVGLQRIEDPERLEQIEPVERGTLIHSMLERFLTECADADPPSAERRAAHLERLRALAAEEFADREARGLTGHALLWRFEQRTILEDLERWYDLELADDAGRRLDRGAFELRFGPKRDPQERSSPLSVDEPLELSLGEHVMRFHGRMDRVNWRETPGGFRVIDYKTGRVPKEERDDRVFGGRAVQLPIYLLAAARILGLPTEAGEAQYLHPTRRGGFKRVRFAGDTLVARREELEGMLAQIAAGIAAGDFHLVPGKNRGNCRYCSFDPICPAARERLVERKAGDPHAQAHAALSEVE